MPLGAKFNAFSQLLEDGWPVIITFMAIIVVALLIVYWPRVAARIERRWFRRR
ncbi:MAG TPA: hypothetical protein VI039_09290 [Solirubrobacterales bacterium]